MKKLMALTIACSCAAVALSLTDLWTKSQAVRIDVVHWGQIQTDDLKTYIQDQSHQVAPNVMNRSREIPISAEHAESESLKQAAEQIYAEQKTERVPISAEREEPGAVKQAAELFPELPKPQLMASPACRRPQIPIPNGVDSVTEEALLAAAKVK